MNIQFQRAIDRYLGIPLCGLLSFFNRFRRGSAVPPAAIRTILVILLSEMGSLVLAHAMFMRLKQKYPNATLHIMLFAKNREILDLLGVIAPENVIPIDDRSLKGFVRDSIRGLWRLWSLRIDVVIDCELFARVSSIFSYLSAAPLRVGFHPHTQEGLYRGSFINRPVIYNPYRHLSAQFLTMVEAIESTTTPKGKLVPLTALPLSPQLELGKLVDDVARQLHADFPILDGKKLVLVNPSGGILPIRAWPLDNFKQVCDSLLAEGYVVGIIGLKEDRPYGKALVNHCQSALCIDFTGYTTSVRHLLALLHRAALLITNDSGPAQFAPLTPVPCIGFFGPETPVLYRPLGNSVFCFYQPLPCSPCLSAYNHRSSSCDGDNQCLKQITPEQVLHKAREMLTTVA